MNLLIFIINKCIYRNLHEFILKMQVNKLSFWWFKYLINYIKLLIFLLKFNLIYNN